MTTSIPLKTTILSISLMGLGLGIGYQQHLRLTRLYPHIDAPPLSTYTSVISSNQGPASSDDWGGGRSDAAKGHIWQLDIPRKLLLRSQKESIVKEGELVRFMNAYWNSAPLTLEGFLVGIFAKLGIVKPFVKQTQTQAQNISPFARGQTLVGGAFIVENDPPSRSPLPWTSTSEANELISGPIFCRWGDISALKSNSLGGYHIFSVEKSPPGTSPSFPTSFPSPSHSTLKEEEEIVRVKWTSYLIRPTSTNSNSESESDSIPMRFLLYFHMLYSRILMDCTARNLGLKVPWV